MAIVLAGVFTLNSCGEKEETKKELAAKARIACDQGSAFLKAIQREDGAICDTSDSLFDIWETTLAGISLYHTTGDSADVALQKALAFLKENENNAGLVCHNVKCRVSYCLETTARYFYLLSYLRGKHNIQNRFDTLYALQKPSGDWDIGNPDVRSEKSFPSVTAFVYNILYADTAEIRYHKEAFAWIRNQQTPEGHFGAAWEYYDCPAYALWQVTSMLYSSDAIGDQNALTKAMEYILTSQREDGSWYYASPGRTRTPSAELQTALMYSALIDLDDDLHPEEDLARIHTAFRKAVQFLLSKQRADGSWDGGFFPVEQKRFPKKEYVFATSQAMWVLEHWYRQHRNSEN